MQVEERNCCIVSLHLLQWPLISVTWVTGQQQLNCKAGIVTVPDLVWTTSIHLSVVNMEMSKNNKMEIKRPLRRLTIYSSTL